MKRGGDTSLEDIAEAITGLGTFVGEQMGALRTEFGQQVDVLRTEFSEQIDVLCDEFGEQSSALRTEFRTEIAELRRDVSNVLVTQSEHGRRLSSVENKVDGMQSDIKELYDLAIG